VFDVRKQGDGAEIRLSDIDVTQAADDEAVCPDGTDDCSQDAVGEYREMSQRSNYYATLDYRHGCQVPDRTHTEHVHPTVDHAPSHIGDDSVEAEM